MKENAKNNSYFVSTLVQLLLASAAAVAGAFVFCKWLLSLSEVTVYGICAATLSLILLVLSLILALPGAVRFFSGKKHKYPVDLLGERSAKRSRLHSWVRVFFAVLFAHILVMVLAYVISVIVYGYNGTFFGTLRDIWLKGDTDIQHYFDIAEHWYITDTGTEIKEHLFLVFLPLYPLCIRGANHILGSSFVSGMVLNTLFSSAAGAVIHELALCDLGRRSSRFAVFCAFALPAAVFYVAPMSEPLFLLLTAAALLCMRKKRFILAGVFGGLAAFTRSLGVVLLVPYAAEAVRYLVETVRYKRAPKRENDPPAKSVPWMVAALIIGGLLTFSGTFAYLLINKLIWGDWFKFMEFQQHWSQSMGYFFSTADYQMDYLVDCFIEGDVATAISLWLPNLMFIFGSLIVLAATARRLRTSYVLYFAAYFVVAIGATWLLSAPRYLTALVVLPLALAKLCEARDDGSGVHRARIKMSIVGVLLIFGQVMYLIMYVLRYKLY